MKKAIIILIILLLAGGTAFYFGWVQFQLSPNTYAVIFTKTSGWEDTVIYPGRFTWRIERLLPTNMTLLTFPLETRSFSAEAGGKLPSGDVYASLMEDPRDFVYSFHIKITYTLDPESLPELAQTYHLTPDTTDSLYDEINQRIEAVFHRILHNEMKSSDPRDIISVFSLLPRLLEEEVVEENPSLEVVSIVPIHVILPDYDLYLHLKEQYFQLMETRHKSLTEEASKMAAAQVERDREFEMLTRYGELLTEYPVLLKYLALKRDDKEMLQELGDNLTGLAEEENGESLEGNED